MTLLLSPTPVALPAAYRDFFVCFNAGRFYEAHEVLESWWLQVRRSPEGNFHKALIQLAGAFVHFQKRRLGPCLALLRSANRYLTLYGDTYLDLDVRRVRGLIGEWESCLQRLGTERGEWPVSFVPRLELNVRCADADAPPSG
jgi:predicted metal-dependent hydrolase